MRFTSGATIIQTESEFHWRPVIIRFAPKFPAYIWAAILTFAIFFLALTLPIALSNSPKALSDAFADYIDFFPGEYWSEALERVFRCNVVTPSNIKYCLFGPKKDLFVEISLSTMDSKITRIEFTLRKNMLNAGDLATLWGRPEVQISGHIAYLDWQNQKIRAIAQTIQGHFDDFLPVSSIAFY